LDQIPDKGWVRGFQYLSGDYAFLLKAAPAKFVFEQSTASISAEEQDINVIVQQFKRFLSIANQRYQQELASRAKRAM
jgi:hypothetical protein